MEKITRRSFLISSVRYLGLSGISHKAFSEHKEPVVSKISLCINTNSVLFEEFSNVIRPPASLVKLMLLYLIAKKINKGEIIGGEVIRMKKTIQPQNRSDVTLYSDKTYPLQWLIDAVTVISSNTCAVALANALWNSEDECLLEMNKTAQELGMTSTFFATVNGFPVRSGVDLDRTTAEDLSKLAIECCKSPLILSWTSKKTFSVDGITERNSTNNLLFNYDGCDGLKTGYTRSAGHCIIATAKRSNIRIVSIVLGAQHSSERFRIAKDLLDIGFAECYCA